MMRWAGLALAWLAGVAWQTQAAALQPAWVLGVVMLAAGALACLAWALNVALPARAGRLATAPVRRALGQALAAKACMIFAVAGLAWASTERRASERMAERIPPAWHGVDVPVIVQVEGLPRAVSGAALFDARVLAWWPDGGAPPDVARRHEGACCTPALLAVRMPLAAAGSLPRAGQRWRLHVRLHAPDGPMNPGGFDPTLGYFERGVRAMARVPAKPPYPPLKLRETPLRPWEGWVDRLRQDTRDRIFALTPDKRAAGVLAGLSVGDQSAIDRDDWEVFRKAGLGHVVSISGTHIAMLGWVAAWVARRAWSRWYGGMHRWAATDVALWAGVLGSFLYALVAGWGVPAQRTVWMMLIVALMRTGGRRWPWPLVWLGSAVILTMLDPWCLRQPGFWLSFVAVGVLMSSGLSPEGLPRAQGLRAPPEGDPDWGERMAQGARQAGRTTCAALAEMVRAQWLVTWALLPLILVCFGQVSVIGFAANLVAIPFFTLGITPLALIGMVFERSWALGAWLIQQVMGVLADMSAWPYATSDLPAVPLWVGVPGIVAGWCMALPVSRAWRLALLPFVLALLYVPHSWRMLPPPDPGRFQLLAVDIGQGTAVLVRTSHHTLLFDTGSRQGTDSNAGDRILVPLLRTLGIDRLDALLISHEDIDHVGGAEAVMKQVPVSWLVSSLDARHPLRAMPDTVGKQVAHTSCEVGHTWTWDGVRFDMLHPTEDELADRAARPKRIKPNAVSCVLRVSDAHAGAAQASVLITGDIGKEEEAVIVARASQNARQAGAPLAVRSTVLIAPHHGSNTSSSAAFLEAVAPQQIVVQAGRRNAYGHPAADVIARYEALGLPWVATPDCGAFLWHSESMSASGQPGRLATGRQSVERRSSGQPAIGQCWRQAHRRYWQGAADPP